MRWHSLFGDIEISRQVWRRRHGVSEDPFALRSGLSSRACSMRLQRAIVAFGLELPYEQCVDQLEFHYGFSVSKSAVRSVVNRLCSAISGKAELLVRTLPGKGEAEVTVEADGSMLPIALFG